MIARLKDIWKEGTKTTYIDKLVFTSKKRKIISRICYVFVTALLVGFYVLEYNDNTELGLLALCVSIFIMLMERQWYIQALSKVIKEK